MFNRLQLIQYACPECDAGYAGPENSAGSNTNCHRCKTDFMIPTGLQPKMLTVGTSQGRPLTPEETAAFYDSPAGRDHRPPGWVPTSQIAPRIMDGGPAIGGTVPVTMTLPNGLGGLTLPVRQDTADSMAKTFLGALIMGIGVMLAAMLGLRKRS